MKVSINMTLNYCACICNWNKDYISNECFLRQFERVVQRDFLKTGDFVTFHNNSLKPPQSSKSEKGRIHETEIIEKKLQGKKSPPESVSPNYYDMRESDNK